MPPRRSSRSTARLAALVSLAAVIASAAQDRPPQTVTQRPQFRTGANYVRVDVHVTAAGQRVRDLTIEDFELFEDNAKQAIEAFELIDIPINQPRTGREPGTVAESREMAADSRRRVFVLYLDTYHTDIASSKQMRQPLMAMLDRMLGPDDLVGVMTPEMTPSQLTFGTRTDSVAGALAQPWGRRDDPARRDPEEERFKTCYPVATLPNVAAELIERRREQKALESLEGLVVHLAGAREERKAILVVSDGWRLYQRNERLISTSDSKPSTVGTPGVGPTGGLTADVGKARGRMDGADCEQDRFTLALLDNRTAFSRLMDLANRGNSSFYTIDPRGLAAWDSSMQDTQRSAAGMTQPIAPSEDQARLGDRLSSLRTLADSTDGLAIVGSNDIARGLTRIADDLASYYLLGYSSTNTKLDGRFREIKVRVKRPGTQVRARRGYRAATEGDLLRSTEPAATPPEPSAVQRAIEALGPARAGLPLRSVAGWIAPAASARGGSAVPTADAAVPPGRDAGPATSGMHLWFVTEMDAQAVRQPGWEGGARAEITVTTGAGTAAAKGSVALPAHERTIAWTSETTLPPGDYTIRVRVSPAAGGGLPYADVQRVAIPAEAPPLGRPRVLRASGRDYAVTADLRFRRTERVRVEWPAAAAFSNLRGDLLDRSGKVTPIPVTVSDRTDDTGGRWIVADASIAPLGTGDYVVRVRADLGGSPHEGVAAFRLVP